MVSLPRPSSRTDQVGRLILAAGLAIALPQLPLGNYLLYPLTILTTWFHEMGHGLTAMALGWEFERLVLLPDGSGVAEIYTMGEPGRFSRALVSAGGPLGPVIAGAALILASRERRAWRPALFALAAAIAISVAIYVRSSTGLMILPLVATALGFLAWRGKAGPVRFALQFLGILAGMSMFRDLGYLLTEQAVIGGEGMLSDTGAIEQALFLPHWLWAGAITLVSGTILGLSLKYALQEDGSAIGHPPAPPPVRFAKR